ncbi:lipopolysaccharide biosynthesis protein [Caulobacter sp.]|uniref:lipopolysaccharide biosynthesis protein n=1 Tax=Caulobacter sp. TaxID=78 RepID=UPI003BB10631
MHSEAPKDKPSKAGGGHKVVTGFSWLMIARLAVMALSFISTAILARILTPADFGVMAAAWLVLALTNAVFEGSFGIGVVQRAEIDDNYISTTLYMSLILAIAMFAIVAVAAPLVEHFFRFPHLGAILTVTAVTLIFKAGGSVSQALLQRRRQFAALAIINIGTYALGFCIVSTVMALKGYGVWSLVGGAVVGGVTEAVASLIVARVPIRVRPDRESMRHVVKTSGFFTISQVLAWAANAGANAVIGRSLGAIPLGIYSRGWKLLDVAVSATAAPMHKVLLPAFARLQNDQEAARRALLKSLSLAAPLFGMVSIFVVLHAHAIVMIALGPKWGDTVIVVQLLFSALIPRCAYKISESLAVGFGRSGAAVVRQGLYAVLMVGGSIIGAMHGPTGVAVAVSIAIWIFYGISLSYAAHLADLRLLALVGLHARSLALGLPVILADLIVMRLLAPVNFWVSELGGGAAGGLVLLALAVLSPDSWLGSELANVRRGVRSRLLALKQRFGARRVANSVG